MATNLERTTPELPQTVDFQPKFNSAYDGSKLLFNLLSAFGWGPLVNLGFFSNLDYFSCAWALRGLHPYQAKLARESIKLFEINRSASILDVGSGRGWSSNAMADLYPHSTVIGIDLIKENIERSRNTYQKDNLEYLVGDATCLPFEDNTFTHLLCLEAAFHFGTKGREKFVKEAARALQKNGKMVLVDFVWKSPEVVDISKLDPDRVVRETWEYDTFASREEYLKLFSSSGISIEKEVDWSTPVTKRVTSILKLASTAARGRAGRRLMHAFHPQTKNFSESDWENIEHIIAAHERVQENCRYMAFVVRNSQS